jgi:CheY-like chemotaxis protein
LEISSQLKEGSRFLFDVTLTPSLGSVAPAALTTMRITRLAPQSQLTALVVDDVADNREVLSMMLQSIGASVSVAKDGARALEKIRLHRPDIVFMDIRMPVMDGIETLRRIKEGAADKQIICVALSAAGWSHDTERYFEVGFDDFVAKPYRFETVCECIERHLDIRFEREAVETGATEESRSVTLDLTAAFVPEPLAETPVACGANQRLHGDRGNPDGLGVRG